ncbi:MAG TPA: cation:proton antiporter [Candidatus Nanoarchaeia archaeon]|nr:cation:proton antiporter [Candidatus Nanoarchaeia archaeon]
MVQTLLTILVCLVVAYFFGELLHKFKIPRIVGQVGAGLFLGIEIIKKILFTTEGLETLSFLAHLGIILLFYYVGLEVDFKTMFRTANRSILISAFNTSLPLLLGFLVSYFLFDLGVIAGLIVGLCLSVSAQSISIELLEELRLIKTRIGMLIISAGMFDDIIELFVITGILSAIQLGKNKLALLTLFFDTLIFVLIIVAARLWFIPFILSFFGKEHSSTARFTASMIIVLLVASLSEVLGLGLIIGALVAGMIVRQTIFKDKVLSSWQEHDIANSVHIVAFGFLIPLFFVWIGLSVNLSLVVENFWLIFLLFVLAIVGTVGGTILAMLLTKGTAKEGLLLGIGLSPKGDIELVIAALALESALITQSIFAALVMMSMLTTIISPILFTLLSARYVKKNGAKFS